MFTCIKDLLYSNKVGPSEVRGICALAWQKLVREELWLTVPRYAVPGVRAVYAPGKAALMQETSDCVQAVMALQVDILVVNCSVFNPTPSLSAAVVNQFRLKPTVITYNLSGMGCSAGLLSIALVRELLQVSSDAHCGRPLSSETGFV